MASILVSPSTAAGAVPVWFDVVTISGQSVYVSWNKLAFGADGVATEVSAANPLPVTFSGGVVLAAGSAAIGSVTVSNLPTTQPISGTVAVSNITNCDTTHVAITSALPAGTNVIGGVTQSGTWNVGLTGALPAGTNALGSVSVSNFPAVQPVLPSDTSPATQNITVADASSTTTSGALGQSLITGAPTAGSAASFAISGDSMLGLTITGNLLGTLQFERSVDGGTTWVSAGVFAASTGQTVMSTTTIGVFHGIVAGTTNFRVRCTAFTSGTATVRIQVSPTTADVRVTNTVASSPAGDNITIGGLTYTVQKAFANATASGDNTLLSATAGKRIRVLSFSIGPVSAAVNVFFKSSVSGAISSTKYLAANSGLGRVYSPFGHFDTVAGEALVLNLSAVANAGVDFEYILV